MPHIQYGDFFPRIVNFVNGAVLADANSPAFSIFQFAAIWRSWLYGQRINRLLNTFTILSLKLRERLLRSPQDKNVVVH